MCRARVAAGLAVLPAGRSAGNHFRFGVCDNTLAADFAALLAFGLLSTLLAADAAFGLVCRVFLFGITLTSARVPDRQAGTGDGLIRMNARIWPSRSVAPGAWSGRTGPLVLSGPNRHTSSHHLAPTVLLDRGVCSGAQKDLDGPPPSAGLSRAHPVVAVRPERTTGPAPHVEEPGWRGSRS